MPGLKSHKQVLHVRRVVNGCGKQYTLEGNNVVPYRGVHRTIHMIQHDRSRKHPSAKKHVSVKKASTKGSGHVKSAKKHIVDRSKLLNEIYATMNKKTR